MDTTHFDSMELERVDKWEEDMKKETLYSKVQDLFPSELSVGDVVEIDVNRGFSKTESWIKYRVLEILKPPHEHTLFAIHVDEIRKALKKTPKH